MGFIFWEDKNSEIIVYLLREIIGSWEIGDFPNKREAQKGLFSTSNTNFCYIPFLWVKWRILVL